MTKTSPIIKSTRTPITPTLDSKSLPYKYTGANSCLVIIVNDDVIKYDDDDEIVKRDYCWGGQQNFNGSRTRVGWRPPSGGAP